MTKKKIADYREEKGEEISNKIKEDKEINKIKEKIKVKL